MAVNKFDSTVIPTENELQSGQRDIIPKTMIFSHYFGVKKLVKINNGHLGKDYSDCADFLNSSLMLNCCPDDLMNSLAKTLTYIYIKDSLCFIYFHHYGMVQRFS